MLKRTSIPALHSAAALLRIAEMPYSGTNSFFIRVLLDKKYALPYRVVSFRPLESDLQEIHSCWQSAYAVQISLAVMAPIYAFLMISQFLSLHYQTLCQRVCDQVSQLMLLVI